VWTEEHTQAFELLKSVFTTMPFLLQLNAQVPIVVKTDASNFAISAVLVNVIL
jgi:hypothetical protein